MNSKKIILSIILLGCMISSPSLFAEECCPSAREFYENNPLLQTSAKVAILGLIASVFVLLNRDPKPDAKPRYNLKQIIDFNLLAKQPKDYLYNLWLIYYDGFVGQCFKDKYMVWKEKSGTIKQSRKSLPFGILGNTYSYLEVTSKTKKMYQGLAATAAAIAAALWLCNPSGFIKFMKDQKDPKPEQPSLDAIVALHRARGDDPDLIAQKYNIDLTLPEQVV